MNDSTPREIAPLTWATFTLRATSPDDDANRGAETLPQSLIVGLLSTGMTPFENLLLGKSRGEQIAATVSRAELGGFFGELPVAPPPMTGDSDGVALAVNILDVRRPDAREMVRAMAAQVEGCGGSCGCGCGGH